MHKHLPGRHDQQNHANELMRIGGGILGLYQVRSLLKSFRDMGLNSNPMELFNNIVAGHGYVEQIAGVSLIDNTITFISPITAPRLGYTPKASIELKKTPTGLELGVKTYLGPITDYPLDNYYKHLNSVADRIGAKLVIKDDITKHLAGRHNQLAHGRTNPTSVWNKYGLDISLGQYLTYLRKIPGITEVEADTDSNHSLYVSLSADDVHALRLEFTSKTEPVFIRTSYYLPQALKDGFGGSFHNKVLNGIENASRAAGFKRLGSNVIQIPLVVAAKRGYQLESILPSDPYDIVTALRFANDAYKYLANKYDLVAPADLMTSIIPHSAPLSSILNTKHANRPAVPLYTEFLLTDEDSADSLGYNLTFYKDL